jgi:hypothetical protein
MEYINKALGSNDNAGTAETAPSTEQTSNESGGFMGALGDTFNSMAGGGKSSEANEGELQALPCREALLITLVPDYLDKA